ncbi:MAG: T9SS type A sorting domain-containing protein [Bacteroidota bacterium]
MNPPGKICSRSLSSRHILLLSLLLVCFTTRHVQAQWIPTNGPPGGIVQSLLAVDSSLFAGSPGAGILKSTDHGQNWVTCNNGLTTWGIFSLGRKGTDLYAGSENGIHKSTDNGNTWTTCYEMIWYQFLSVATNATTVFASSLNGGVYKSTDDGQTWSVSNLGLPGSSVYSVHTDGNYAFAGMMNGGLYRSTDNGSSWNFMGMPGFTPVSMLRWGGYLFCGTGSRVMRSANNGVDWTEMLYTGTMMGSIVADSLGLYAASYGNGVYFSSNLGLTWSLKTGNMADSLVNTLAFSGDVLVAGSDVNGAARSLNHGTSWSLANSGIRSVHITAMCAAGNDLYTGSASSGVSCSHDGGATWQYLGLQSYESTVLAVAKKEPFLFAARYDGLFRKDLADSAWVQLTAYPGTFTTVLAVKDNWLFAGTGQGGLFRSNDDGNTWQRCNSCFADSTISDIVARDNKLFTYVTGDGLYVSNDNGGQWTYLGWTLGQHGAKLAANADYLFVASQSEGIYRSPDNGITREAINSGIPSYPDQANDIITLPGYVVISMDPYGIYISSDNGGMWTRVDTGMVDEALNLAAIGDTIYCGTRYVSVWKRYIYNILSTGNPPAACGNIVLYPNPAGDAINLCIPEALKGVTEVTINGLSGSQVFRQTFPQGLASPIDISHLPRGVYILQASGGKHSYIKRFVITRP